MIIDGHAHACGNYLNVDSIVKSLNKENVLKVLLVPGELNSTKTYSLPNFSKIFPKSSSVSFTNILTKLIMSITGKVKHIEAGNEYVYSLVEKNPERILQFYWITKTNKDIQQTLNKNFSNWKFKGIKMHQCWENFSIESDYFKIVAKWAEEKEL